MEEGDDVLDHIDMVKALIDQVCLFGSTLKNEDIVMNLF